MRDSGNPKVLQVITHLALGGAERVAFNLMRGMRDRFHFALYVANGIDPGDVGRSMQRELEQMNVPLFVGTSVPIKFGGMLLSGMLRRTADWINDYSTKTYLDTCVEIFVSGLAPQPQAMTGSQSMKGRSPELAQPRTMSILQS